jgi:hypothetical protein
VKTVFTSSHETRDASQARGGTSTSSIRWPRKVALARISTSRKVEFDWKGIAASLSSRCNRQGEWMSATGTANTQRQGIPTNHRQARSRKADFLRPTTWSHRSIASSNGSRWPAVQDSRPVVTRTNGRVAPESPRSTTDASPSPGKGVTITASVPRPRALSNSSIELATVLAASSSSAPALTTSRRTAPPVRGSRRK